MKIRTKGNKDNYTKYITAKSNQSGRPTGENTKKFGPEPKSIIITQILNELNKQRKFEMRSTSDIPVIITDSPIETTTETNEILPQICNETVTDKLYSCDHPGCKYTSKESSNLTKHKRIHTKERPYLCDQCSFRSNFVNSLKTHKRLHSDDKPYICEYCSYRCNSSSNLKKHHQHRHAEATNR